MKDGGKQEKVVEVSSRTMK